MEAYMNFDEIKKANPLFAAAPDGFAFRGASERSGPDVWAKGVSSSHMLDHLLRMAAKWTVSNADDILPVIDRLQKAQEANKPLCVLLHFFFDGIEVYDAGFDTQGELFVSVPRDFLNAQFSGCQWLLAYVPLKDGSRIMGITLVKPYLFFPDKENVKPAL